jgi:hypothetical protein
MSCFIVIETFGGAQYAAIVTDQDGNNKVFDSYPQAEEEAADCQDGLIVEL